MTLSTVIGIFGAALALVLALIVARDHARARRIGARLEQICEPMAAFSGAVPAGEGFSNAPLGLLGRKIADKLSLSEGGMLLNFLLLALPALVGVCLYMLGVFAAAFVAMAGVTLHQYAIRSKRERRARAFIEALPNFLERTRQFILIGNTLQQAILKALVNADPVVVDTLEPIMRRVRHGASFTESMDGLARQINQLEVHMLCACISANMRFGGRVAQNLANLTLQINNRLKLQREIRAATAETRVSAVALLSLTIGASAYVITVNPDYIAFFFESGPRQIMLAAIVVWPLIGLLVMRRMLSIRY